MVERGGCLWWREGGKREGRKEKREMEIKPQKIRDWGMDKQ